MTAAFLITLREGLEAALIVGILLSYLSKIGQEGRRSFIWIGVLTAALASGLLAGLIQILGVSLQGRSEEIFEGTTMFLAVGMLTWVIFWMRYQARLLKNELEQGVQRAVDTGRNAGLFSLAFLAVFREGVETALFLSAAAFASPEQSLLVGAALGLVAAVLIGYLAYASSVHLSVRAFFNLTSLLLLLFAAGLLAHGIHEFQEAGIFPTLMSEVWNTNHLLDEDSPPGQLLRALFGYNGNPSLEEVVGYVLYWVATLLGVRWWMRNRFAKRLTPA